MNKKIDLKETKLDYTFWRDFMPTYQMSVILFIEKENPEEFERIQEKLLKIRRVIEKMPTSKSLGSKDLSEMTAFLHYFDCAGNQWWMTSIEKSTKTGLGYQKLCQSYPEGEFANIPYLGLVLADTPNVELDLDFIPSLSLQDIKNNISENLR